MKTLRSRAAALAALLYAIFMAFIVIPIAATVVFASIATYQTVKAAVVQACREAYDIAWEVQIMRDSIGEVLGRLAKEAF